MFKQMLLNVSKTILVEIEIMRSIFSSDVWHDSNQIQLWRCNISQSIWFERKMVRPNPPDTWSRMVCCFMGILNNLGRVGQVKTGLD